MKIKIKKKDNKIKAMSKNIDNRKKNKLRKIVAYIFGRNRQIREYHITASRKFNIDDETYVIKEDSYYLKKINDIYEQIYFYVEGNPNPFKLENAESNVGLTKEELDSYIGGDIFNILIECQEQDRSKYVIHLVVVSFVVCVIQFISMFW